MDDVEALAEVLAAHRPLPLVESGGILIGYGCPAPCAWGNEGGYDLDAHRAHLAAILAEHTQAARAEGGITALEEAARDYAGQRLPDAPLYAHDVAADWLRARAAALRTHNQTQGNT